MAAYGWKDLVEAASHSPLVARGLHGACGVAEEVVGAAEGEVAVLATPDAGRLDSLVLLRQLAVCKAGGCSGRLLRLLFLLGRLQKDKQVAHGSAQVQAYSRCNLDSCCLDGGATKWQRCGRCNPLQLLLLVGGGMLQRLARV